MLKKMKANRMLLTALLAGALTLSTLPLKASDELDPRPTAPETAAITPDAPNVVIVQIDENGKETCYAGKTTATRDSIRKNNAAAAKAVAEVVTDANIISDPGIDSGDELDRVSSTPNWFYIGFGGFGVGIGCWAPCYYYYSYTWCPPAPVYCYRPVYCRPRCHYRFYWR